MKAGLQLLKRLLPKSKPKADLLDAGSKGIKADRITRLRKKVDHMGVKVAKGDLSTPKVKPDDLVTGGKLTGLETENLRKNLTNLSRKINNTTKYSKKQIATFEKEHLAKERILAEQYRK